MNITKYSKLIAALLAATGAATADNVFDLNDVASIALALAAAAGFVFAAPANTSTADD